MVSELVARWLSGPERRHFSCHRTLPASAAQEAPFPEWMPSALSQALRRGNVASLYAHQARAIGLSRAGRNVVIATPTASGKSLCFQVPVMSALLEDPSARALYLFPTKALARDQVEAARGLVRGMDPPIGVEVYDGDTPPDRRRAARRQARIIATNPDMLHTAILPHHTSWAELMSGLCYVVIDELHTYRGVFGSHLSHVLRRLQRIARFHGANPRFIASSATIANPQELAETLCGLPFEVVTESGAPTGTRHFLLYNPPLIDPALGVRESYLAATCQLARALVAEKISTLIFCRSRLTVEVLVRQLKNVLAELDGPEPSGRAARAERVRGYRGGYLPNHRRNVEHALRAGDTDVVVTTSALEVGIDIGALDAVILAGWPGSRAAAWQRAGRAGRRLAPSLAVLVASSEPVDQFVAADPDYLLGQAPEHARINPDNASIVIPELKCAAYELPFTTGEAYGNLSVDETAAVLDCLVQAQILHRSGQLYSYTDHPYPATEVHLRGQLDENFLVVDESSGAVLAEVDYDDAPQVLHDHAIYQLEGALYQVHRLDHSNHKAYVSSVAVDYYTDALTHSRVRVLEAREDRHAVAFLGEVHVLHRVVGFKKITLHTSENAGYGDVNQPERQMHTTALWVIAPTDTVAALDAGSAEVAEAALGAAYTLHSAAALLLMSDPRDLGRAVGDARAGWFAVSGRRSRGNFSAPNDGRPLLEPGPPTIFLFDRYTGGTGLAERLFECVDELLARASGAIARCGCERGCPACIGPGGTRRGKALAHALLEHLQTSLCHGDAAARAQAAQLAEQALVERGEAAGRTPVSPFWS